ncbi:MAG: PAS domain S-box protein [Bryobacteraceae bacterium]
MNRGFHLAARPRFVLLLVLPSLLGIATYVASLKASQKAAWVNHTLEVELSLQRLSSALARAEAAQRSYLLTGEPGYLPRSQAAGAEARREIGVLKKLTEDNSGQQGSVARMQWLLDSRLDHLNSTVRLYEAGAPRSVLRGVLNEGEQLAASIRPLATELQREEDRLLRERDSERLTASRRFFWLLAAGYVLVVFVVASLYRGLAGYERLSSEAEARLSKLNAELEQRIRDRTVLLQAREELLSIFVRHVPAAVAMLDRDMIYLQASDRWCDEYGVPRDRLMGRSHYEVFPDLPDRWKELHRRCLAGETLRSEGDRWDRADGQIRWMRWEIRPWGQHDGLPEGILLFADDITRRKETREKLQESEATIRALLETAAQGILAADANGLIVLTNRMADTMFGYHQNELSGQSVEILMPGASRKLHHLHRSQYMNNPRTRPMGMGLDLLGLRKDGSEFPIEVSLSSIETSRGRLAVSFISDITSRKHAETALRESEQHLRALAGGLMTAQEDERRRVARELHDDVTQRLAFLSIGLGALAKSITDSRPEIVAQSRSLQKQASETSNEVRRLSHGLHPSIIEDFGLSSALEEFCVQFAQAQGVQVIFDDLDEDSPLDPTVATCLYRIAQESVRNSITHGHATEVRVVLSAESDGVRLRVRDNGIGFLPDAARVRSGIGLAGMQERVRLVSGTLQISSEPGEFSEITAWAPWNRVRHETDPNFTG